jgi:hypothetical protein
LGVVSLFAGSLSQAAIVEAVAPGAVNVGDVFAVSIDGREFPPTQGGGVVISWDTSLLALDAAISAASIEAELLANGFSCSFSIFNLCPQVLSFDTAAGQIALSIVDIDGVLASGDFNFFNLSFEALAAADPAQIVVSAGQQNWTDLTTGSAVALVPEFIGADIVVTEAVSAVPIPGAVWLFGSGLVGIAGIGRRRRTA